jgi:predicted amidohydrolase
MTSVSSAKIMNHPLPKNPLRVTLVQNSAGSDHTANLAWLEKNLPPADATDLIALPEVFAFRGNDDDYRAAAEPADGKLACWLAAQANVRRAWLLAGSVLERDGKNIFNTSLLFDRSGRLVATYRKIHLFEARLESGHVIRERDVYEPGDHPVMADIEGWRCGLSICYDVRFPELFRHYSEKGATLLAIPSNFTQHTGRDHWETLVRARAIENQCFVIAPDQCGANPRIRSKSHGHTLAVGPWGEVLAAAADEPAVLNVTLDPALLRATRERVPALAHRRM